MIAKIGRSKAEKTKLTFVVCRRQRAVIRCMIVPCLAGLAIFSAVRKLIKASEVNLAEQA
jgi:hypothetical protein